MGYSIFHTQQIPQAWGGGGGGRQLNVNIVTKPFSKAPDFTLNRDEKKPTKGNLYSSGPPGVSISSEVGGRPIKVGGGNTSGAARPLPLGVVWGHAPPENFGI